MGFLKHQQDGFHLGMFFFPESDGVSDYELALCATGCVFFLEPDVCLYIYIYVVGTFRVYFVPLGNAIIIEKNQQKSHLMDLSFHWLLVKRDQLVSRPYSDQE